jgi:hypothetical protein
MRELDGMMFAAPCGEYCELCPSTQDKLSIASAAIFIWVILPEVNANSTLAFQNTILTIVDCV